MDKQYGEFVGVDNVHVAIVTEDTRENYLAETPEYLAPTAEIAGEAETDSTPTYYDNVPAFTYVGEGLTTLTLTVSGIPADIAAKYLGKKYDSSTGRVYDDGQPNPPDVALSFRYNKGPNDYRYYQYLKGTFSGGSEEAGTKTNTVDIRTYQLTYSAVVTTHQWEINGESKGLKRIFADTTDQSFDPTGWFNAVQTPEMGTKPNALSLVTSVPIDEATGVAIDSAIELTFNNKISNQTITLFTDAFVPVPVTITKDATGKILTISPDADLSSATSYVLIITNATDIYGQKLENEVIAFTTA